MVRLVIADDDVKVRSAIGLILGQDQACWQVIAYARDFSQLLKIVEVERPELILLDWGLSEGENSEGGMFTEPVREIKQVSPDTRVLVLGCEPKNKQESLNAGADGFVSKMEPPEVFLQAVYGLRAPLNCTHYPIVLKQYAVF